LHFYKRLEVRDLRCPFFNDSLCLNEACGVVTQAEAKRLEEEAARQRQLEEQMEEQRKLDEEKRQEEEEQVRG
jgi:hypothetical protein